MKIKNIIISLMIFIAMISLWIVLGVNISNNALEFLPLSIILGFLVTAIYLSIVNKDDALVVSLKKGLDFIISYFERAFEILIDTVKGTREKLDWLWIFGMIFTVVLSVVYGVIFLYVSVVVVAFTLVVTIITTLSCCVAVIYYYFTNKKEKKGILLGVISAVIIIALYVWHILNMIL